MSYKLNSFIASDKKVASYEKRLSICLESNGFSFSVISLRDELLQYCDVECNTRANVSDLLTTIRGVLADTGIQPFGFKETELIVMSRLFAWIPAHLYDEGRQRSYLEALGHIDTGMGVYSEYNDVLSAYMVFAADNGQVSAFKIAFPGLKVRCQHSKMVDNDIVEESDLKSVMLLNLRDGETDYAVFCNKKLQLSNTFDCSGFGEALYHALNITKQFHLEDAMMSVSVCGDVDREKYAQLRGYFPNVKLHAGRKLKLTVAEMQHIPAYRHALLFM